MTSLHMAEKVKTIWLTLTHVCDRLSLNEHRKYIVNEIGEHEVAKNSNFNIFNMRQPCLVLFKASDTKWVELDMRQTIFKFSSFHC